MQVKLQHTASTSLAVMKAVGRFRQNVVHPDDQPVADVALNENGQVDLSKTFRAFMRMDPEGRAACVTLVSALDRLQTPLD